MAHQQLMLLFQARHHLCAIPADDVAETMRPLPLTPLAAASSFVLGLCKIRGKFVPVVDAGALLGADDVPRSTRFIALRVEDRVVALAVEAVLGMGSETSRSLQDLPPLLGEASGALISTLGTLDGAFLLVLRAARIFAEADMAHA